MKVRSFFRTLFNCSNWDKEIEEKRRKEAERRMRLNTMISKKTESIAKKTREVEAGAELMKVLRKDMS